MDQIVREIVRFERFALDLNRCSLTIDGSTIDLRPKTFEALRCLAMRAGQLVSKDELLEVAWPGVTVGDDSLSQCIHELRQHLRDTDRRLIKTISRRGYLLDARPVVAVPLLPSVDEPPASAPNESARRSPYRARAIAIGSAIVIAACAVVLLVSVSDMSAFLRPFGLQAENLLSSEDASRLSTIAAQKELPVPVVRIAAPDANLPEASRKLIGVWISDSGWIVSGRQFMLIVTHVSKDGTATGYFVNGPAKPASHVPGPAFSARFTGRVDGGTLRHDGKTGRQQAFLSTDGRMEFRLVFQDGTVGTVMLDPFWRLPQRARTVALAKPL